MGFAKLDDEFAGSSLLAQGGLVMAGFWAVLLSLKGREGRIYESPAMLAKRCNSDRFPVNASDVRGMLDELAAPDPESRTPDNEGRRIVIETEPRFCVVILNHEKYFHRDKTAAERSKRYRESHGPSRVTHGANAGPLSILPTCSVVSAEEGVQGEPQLPPADRAERAIRQSTDALRTKLYALVAEAQGLDPKHRDPTVLMQLFTGYSRPDGSVIRGVVNAALLSHERLEKSIADAEGQIAEWRQKRGA